MRRFDFVLDSVANCIRLAHKYNIPDVLADALEELKESFPDALCDGDTWAPSVDAIVAVNLARLIEMLSMPHFPLYECCRLSGDALLSGRKRSDGLLDTLSTSDLALCFNAKGCLCARTVVFVTQLFVSRNLPSNTNMCTASTTCCASVFCLHSKGIEEVTSGYCAMLCDWSHTIKSCNRDLRPKTCDPLCKSCIRGGLVPESSFAP